jgi:hypothetical protein
MTKLVLLLSSLAFSSSMEAWNPNGNLVQVRGTKGGAINGSPTFGAPNIYKTGANDDPRFLTHGDFNGDKFEDIAIAASGTGLVGIWLNVGGKGNFVFNGGFQADAVGLRGITTGDFNGDGKLDIATANTSTNLVSILIGNGDGSFQPPVTYPTGLTGSYTVTPFYIATQRVLSLAVSSQISGAGMAVLPGIGDGGFLASSIYQGADAGGVAGSDAGPGIAGAFASTGPISPWDINGDGLLDLVAGDSATDGVWIARWLGLPDGGFSPAIEQRAPGISLLPQTSNGHVHSAIPWDCNVDNVMDIVASASKGMITIPGTVPLSYQVGSGSNLTSQPLDMSFGDILGRRWIEPDKSDFTQIALGDFNGDGIQDFAVTVNDSSNVVDGVMIFINDGNCRLSPPIYMSISGALPFGQFAFGITAADFNADGVTDIAVATEFSSPDRLYVWISNGPPTQVNLANVASVNLVSQPVPTQLQAMNPPTVFTFSSSAPQFLTGCPPMSCWNILCNYPAEYSTTFAIDAGAFVTPAAGLEVPAHGSLRGDYGWEKDVCLTSPYGTPGDYMSETIIELVSAADGGICKVAQHKTFQQNQ